MRSRRGPSSSVLLFLTLLATAAAAPAARAANVNVDVGGTGFTYSPSTVTIQAGDSVTWINRGGMHNVTADGGGFRCASGCDGEGGDGDPSSSAWTATHTFTQAGTFGYHCEIHGSAVMHGTVTVQSGGGGGGDHPGTLRFSQTGYSVSEGVGAATITVSRVDGDDGAASVVWHAAAGTATAGADFTAGTATLNWADHDDANKSFTVPITNDTAVESNETVLLSLTNATGAALDPARQNATLTIVDNDGSGGPPSAPTNLTATAASTSEIALAWHDVNGETGYQIENKTLGGTYHQVATVGANVTSFVAGGLAEATFYSFRIRAQNGAALSPYSNEAGAATDTVPAPCIASATTLCLNNNRFQVDVAWRYVANGANVAGDGNAVPLPSAPDSGLFYFFSSTNIEMLIKVLNACTISPPRYWVFYAATTNVEIRTTVIDTQTGKVRVYFNPLGTAAPPIQDVNAFATCP